MSMYEMIMRFNALYMNRYLATYAPTDKRGWYMLTLMSVDYPNRCIGSFCKKARMETYLAHPELIDLELSDLHEEV